MSRIDADLARARAALLEAGAIALAHFGGGHRSWEKGPGQIVTEADIAVDRLLRRRLLEGDPSDGWLSEESEDDPARLNAERVWIVDPIDGTRSFAAGKPEFVVSIALLEAGEPVLGLLLNPATDELFEAVRGRGARLNGAAMRIRADVPLARAEISVSETENRRRRFDQLLPVARFTSIGSLAYKLGLVAAGRFDAYLSWRRAHDWDIAAAHLLLTEAGGILTTRDGNPIRYNQPLPVHQGLVAAAAPLHQELITTTAALLPTAG